MNDNSASTESGPAKIMLSVDRAYVVIVSGDTVTPVVNLSACLHTDERVEEAKSIVIPTFVAVCPLTLVGALTLLNNIVESDRLSIFRPAVVVAHMKLPTKSGLDDMALMYCPGTLLAFVIEIDDTSKSAGKTAHIQSSTAEDFPNVALDVKVIVSDSLTVKTPARFLLVSKATPAVLMELLEVTV